MASVNNFTEGKIAGPLVRFALPMLLAFCLQSLYSAVDLLVVGQFGTPADVSAVSTGGQMMQMVLVVVTGLSMGATILLGQAIGAGKGQESGSLVGTSIVFFTGLALLLTAVMLLVTVPFARLMQTPKAASELLQKLLSSAVANAENNHNMDVSKLYVAECLAGPGPILKRIRPASKGRANRILKRTTHVTLVLKEKE